MAKKKPANSGQSWTARDIKKLEKLAKRNTPTEEIADSLERSESAIYSKASEEGISLKPKDKT